MEEKNKKIFLAILWATICVVAIVWIATSPKSTEVSSQSTSTPVKAVPLTPVKHVTPATYIVPPAPEKPVAAPAPKAPVPPSTSKIDIPTIIDEKPISKLTIPDIIPPATGTKHVDPRIAATVLTSGDEFDRLMNGTISLFVSIFAH